MTRIEIFINKQLVDIVEEDIKLRLNQLLWEPNKTVTRQTEWSFSFNLPSTPTNNKIFQNANILAVNGKFHQRYKTEVYADGILIYDGSLILNEYNGQTKQYNCNLVNIKTNTLDDIFGEAVMTDAQWLVEYSGVPTINEVNEDMSKKYFFPLVCYGAFQKTPISEDEVGRQYTSKHRLDATNKWWHESFYPSLGILETMKKLFEWKGYNVGGRAYSDEVLNDIYASTNLADEQSPDYNIGSPLFGDLELSATFSNIGKTSQMILQDLNYKYYKVPKIKNIQAGQGYANNDDSDYDWNLSEICWWNMLDNDCSTISIAHKQYMFDPNEHLIVIPADGWYTVQMSANVSINQPASDFTTELHIRDYTKSADDQDDLTRVALKKTINDNAPIEIQLIRNYDDNIELIKGKNNVFYGNGNPNDATYNYDRAMRRWKQGGYVNKNEWVTCYPHENLYGSQNPTSQDELWKSATKQLATGLRGATDYNREGARGTGERVGSFSGNEGQGTRKGQAINGYSYDDTYTMAYDPAVSEAFICGFSSFGKGTAAVAKNGKSWSPLGTTSNKIMANVKGYSKVNLDGTTEQSALNYNSYNTAGNTNYVTLITGNTQQIIGNVQCCVYLKKNDKLEIALVQRAYGSAGQAYECTGNVHLHLRAISNKSEAEMRSDSTFNMYSNSRFPTKLNLFNFTNKETKITDWITNVCKAFNLELVTDGNNVYVDTNKGIKKDGITYAIDLDDRAKTEDAISSRIEYARRMAVTYKIADKEAGFEQSVPPEWIDTEEWNKHGNSGFNWVQMADDSYVTEEISTSTNFSYTWYDTFIWCEVDNGEDTGWEENIELPIIIDSQYFIEGALDDDSMKHDGYGLTQRFWYRMPMDEHPYYVTCSDVNKETVDIVCPVNKKYGINLSYFSTEKSLLSEYFNFRPMLDSNYVKIDAHITAEEYKQLTGGAKVKFDDDIYYIVDIEGFDPTNINKTTLKLVKKTD